VFVLTPDACESSRIVITFRSLTALSLGIATGSYRAAPGVDREDLVDLWRADRAGEIKRVTAEELLARRRLTHPTRPPPAARTGGGRGGADGG
jgi:hypothetical protein